MKRSYYGYELNKLVKELLFVPYKLKGNSKHEVGKTYWCSYWHRYYKVLDINGYMVKIQWDEGTTAEHCTSLDKLRDYELRPFESTYSIADSDKVVFDIKQSVTGAEIKALCCAGIIDESVSDSLMVNYFDRHDKYQAKDDIYYFVSSTRDNMGTKKIILQRDLEKSPKNPKRKMQFYNFSNHKNITIGDYIQLYELNDKTKIFILDIKTDEVLFEDRVDYLQYTSEGCMHDLCELSIDRFVDSNCIMVDSTNYSGRKGVY